MMKSLHALLTIAFLAGGVTAGVATVQGAELQDRGDAMLKNAEDMVAHGGMGDAKAIVHHCGEVKKEAETILKALPPSDAHSPAAAGPLKETIRYCDKVAQLGDRVDPGVSLNPATKARAAAREAAKHLALIGGRTDR